MTKAEFSEELKARREVLQSIYTMFLEAENTSDISTATSASLMAAIKTENDAILKVVTGLVGLFHAGFARATLKGAEFKPARNEAVTQLGTTMRTMMEKFEATMKSEVTE